MKKIRLLIITLICLFVVNVKADMGPPSVIIDHKVIVTNKNGAQCYDAGKKTKEVIPYKTTLEVIQDIVGDYIYVENDKYHCDVKYSDVSAKDQNFNMNKDEVEKVDNVRAIVLAKGGLNLRKGPSVTYSKILTVPQYTIVTITHSAGTYWYHTTYNGKSGWITSMEKYLGFESDEILINYKDVTIYDSTMNKKLGKIPANTPIEDYISVVPSGGGLLYYVIYNGIKGYIDSDMLYKIDSPGKIKLTEDLDLYDEKGNPSKKITAGQELEYTMTNGYTFYIPERNIEVIPGTEGYEFVKEGKILTKTHGYLGEGLFGEAKEEVKVTATPKNEEVKEKEEKKETELSTKDIIIIALLAGILLALTALVIIKLVNNKKNKVNEQNIVNENKEV